VARVPIVHIGNTLIATVHEELHDRDALDLQADLATMLERTGADAVVLDFSVVQTVDSFLGRLINDLAGIMRLLGAQTVVVGLQPAVAMTLVELGLELRDVRTALNPRKGLELLNRLTRAERRGRWTRRGN
jgi:rsbT antagonist protein RsbS